MIYPSPEEPSIPLVPEGGSSRTSQRNSPYVPPLSSTPLSLAPISTVYELHTPKDRLKSPKTNSSDDFHASYEANIPYTPTGEEAEIYKYYCPLCMLYFKSILKSKCCGNYICFLCTKDYLHTKHVYDKNQWNPLIVPPSSSSSSGNHYHNHNHHNGNNENVAPNFFEDIKNNILLNEIACPHCFTHGFHINHVTSSEKVRDYSMRLPFEGSYSTGHAQPSPIRVGESFEELKRKMIPFKVLSHSNSMSCNSTDLNPASNTTPVPRLSIQVEESHNLSSRSRGDRDLISSSSARIAGIAMTEGNESPLLSPQSTYRSRENSPTSDHRHRQADLEFSSTEALSPTNLFARTLPINDDQGPAAVTIFRRSSREYERLKTSMDDVSESVDPLDDSLAGMRILARKERVERDLATDVIKGVFSNAFSHRQIHIHQ